MARKASISLSVKLAAALLQMKRPTADGSGWERIISHEEARQLTAKQIISRFQFDHHPIREVDGGPAEPWNLDPMLTAEHRAKTAKIDLPQIAKGKRIRKAEVEHAERMARKGGHEGDDDARRSKVIKGLKEAVRYARATRPMPGSKASPFKRKIRGGVELRHGR